jgi:APA family basic amino acid/polyamine antiporter
MLASVRIGAERGLVRELGRWQLATIIFNYTVGTGIFVLPALMVAQLGSAAPLAYLLCAAIIGLVVLVFAEAGSRVSATGGPYAYVEAGLGPLPGLITGVLLIVSDIAAAGAITSVLAASLQRLTGTNGAVPHNVIGALLVVALAAINIAGLRSGARLVEVCSAAKLAPLLFFVAAGVFVVKPANLQWAALPTAGRVAAASGTLIFAFSGIETALLPSGEVRTPSRTVPQACMLALAFVTVLYLAVQAVALGAVGPALAADSVAPLATAAATFSGTFGSTLLLVGATISTFGWLTGAMLGGPRGVFALGRDGFLPRRLAAVHPRFHTPHVAIATYAVLVIAASLSDTFERLIVFASIGTLAIYFLCPIALWRLRQNDIRADGQPFRLPGGPIIPLLTCMTTLWVAWQTISMREFVAFGVVLLLCAAAYAIRRLRT